MRERVRSCIKIPSCVALFYHKKRSFKQANMLDGFLLCQTFFFLLPLVKHCCLWPRHIWDHHAFQTACTSWKAAYGRGQATLAGLMPLQKAAYSAGKQDGSREAGRRGCISGEATSPASFHWNLCSKKQYALYETHPLDCRSALAKGWEEAAMLAVHLCRKPRAASLKMSEA